jgi:tetratricopeptide (TPR) repeat protein
MTLQSSSRAQDTKVVALPEGYQEVPEADRKKAASFFNHARAAADTGNYDYSIELFMQGLTLDPDDVAAHQSLRELSIKRKINGGKDLGMLAKMKFKAPSKDDKQNMLNAERLLAHDPGNTDLMQNVMTSALKAGYYDTTLWMGPILNKAIEDSGKPDLNKYIVLRDTYARLKEWKPAVEACQKAAELKPNDMDLQTALKNLGAQLTMTGGGYDKKGGSFRDSVRDMDSQTKLMNQDKEVHTLDVMGRLIADAEAQYAADPNESGKLMKLVDTLLKTESLEHENRAIELLEEWYNRTKQFRFRQNMGAIRLKQLDRAERAMKADLAANPTDAAAKQNLVDFHKDKLEQELVEYQLWAENYPTESKFKFEVGKRMFQLGQFDQAIPMFQQVRQDPKYRTEAGIFLGRAFLDAQFVDEAADTLKALIDEYQVRGDDKSKEMNYWYGRALEAREDFAAAIKSYSQVAQWDFNYRDVQTRIKKLRAAAAGK